MKKINKYLLLFAMTLGFASCSNWIDPDLNVNPDTPGVVPMEFLLPSVHANMGYALEGNDAARTTALWLQYFDGLARQSLAQMTYSYTPADCNNLWNTLYGEIMTDAKEVIRLAEEQNSPHFKGVAQVCIAVTLGHTTDLWGDIPYSDAFQGASVLQPKLDTQAEIYTTIQSMLDDAIVNLSATENAVDVDGDMIYGGDIAAWIKAANALKARYALQLSEVNGTSAYTEALSYLAAAFAANDDDLQFNFGTNTSEYNPIKQFLDQRAGDIAMASTFVDRLAVNSDPRLDFYAEPSANGGVIVGSVPGSESTPGDISLPGSYIASGNSPVYFMTYAEQKFIEAEANMGLANPGPAAAAYKEAVAASVLKVTGEDNQVWLDANINAEDAASITMEKIMEQKYIALYGQLQSYSDYRRTGFPNDLLTVIGATDPNMPVRFPYAQDEVSYNLSVADYVATNKITINSKIWWDK